MSVQVMSWVLDHSKSHLGARLVLLAIANHANEHGENAWPRVSSLAREAHLSERQVSRAIRDLCSMGELVVYLKAGPAQANMYRVVMGGDILSPPVVTNRAVSGDKSCSAIRMNRPEPSKPKTPLTPLKKGGTCSPRMLRRINQTLEKRKGAWAGIANAEREKRVEQICADFGTTAAAYYVAFENETR